MTLKEVCDGHGNNKFCYRHHHRFGDCMSLLNCRQKQTWYFILTDQPLNRLWTFAHVSRSPMVRLNTGRSGVESGSAAK